MGRFKKAIGKFLLNASGSKIVKRLKEIRKYEYIGFNKLKKIQSDKLEKLLLHSYLNVPYYKKHLEDNKVIDKELNVNLSNFKKLPILTKNIIRDNYETLKSLDYKKRKAYENTSGGSTGEPLLLIQDKEYSDWNIANKIYLKTFGGQEIGDKEIRLWGSDRDLLEGKESLNIRFRNWFYNRREFNFFKVSDDDLLNYIKKWNRFKPAWIETYVQSIFEFAKYIKKNQFKLYSPRGILTSAGTLFPEIKDLIEEVFECKIYNRYGSREVGDVACSCEKDEGLHVSPWNHYLEILDDNYNEVKPGDIGKIYVTSLNNYSMPLIRYGIGDIGIWSEKKSCSCGRSAPMLKSVKGRIVDLFKTDNNEFVYGGAFTHLLFHKKWVKQFQFVQKDINLIKIKIVRNHPEEINVEDIREVENNLKKIMGINCKVQWNYIDEIPPSKSGKYLYTKSELYENFEK